MIRRTAHCGASFVCGCLLGTVLSAYCSILLIPCIVLAVSSLFLKNYARSFAIFLALGCGLYSFEFMYRSSAQKYDGQYLTLDCVVEEQSGSSMYICSTVFPDSRRGKIGLYIKDDGYTRGDSIQITGLMRTPRYNSGYYASRSVFLITTYPHVEKVVPVSGFFRALARFRTASADRIRSRHSGAAGELLVGMLFGSRFSELTVSERSALYAAGLGHITAVSGLHLSILAAFLSGIFKDRRLRFAAAVTGALAGLFMADFGISAVRAFIMVTITLCAPLVMRRTDPLTSLFAAVFIILIHDPLCITNASFVLSVSGVLGAGVISSSVCSRIEDHKNDRLTGDKEYHISVPLSSAVSVLCASLTAWVCSSFFFDELSVISPVANLLLSPAAALVITLGAFSAAVGAVFPAFSYVLFVFCRAVCVVILNISEKLADIFPPIPAPDPALAVICAAAMTAFLMVVKNRKLFAPAAASLTAVMLMVHCAALMLAPDHIEYGSEDPSVTVITKKGTIFINPENTKLSVPVRTVAILCTADMKNYYLKQAPDAQIVEISDDCTYHAGDLLIYKDGDDIRVDRLAPTARTP